jgi:hypothetical protein
MTLQQCFTFRKQHSLVLKSLRGHDGTMRTKTETTKKNRIRASLRHIWQDTHHASRAQFRPYDDYLQQGRNTH